jgi:type III pantothenate kinase
MLLLLDVGNSRLKWALVRANQWIAHGAVAKQDIGTLALTQWQTLPRPQYALGVNVAGEAVRVRVEAQLARWRVQPYWLAAGEHECGLHNQYQPPGQLGSDRWAALIAGWERCRASCLVVNAGTALTVDALQAQGGEGLFRGGLIVPGLRIMRQALADHTAALKLTPGEFRDFPTSTADAVWTGTIRAACGAIEGSRASLAAALDTSDPVPVLLTGGAAAELAPHLNEPVTVVDNLVLEGVLAIAAAHSLA